jgi:hypothetical protein
MSSREPSTVDRLAERSFVDRWGFMLFAFGGAAVILIAKRLGIDAVIVAVSAAAIIAAYAVIVQRSGTGRLRGDQAGDNCYYLGLIFTLVSLGYAIFFFNPADQATSIIQGFGVALSTTVMGLILRVFFNQSRVDLVQTEDSARIELAEAAGRLKAELSGITVSMNDFSRQTRQSLEELRDGVVQSLTEVRDAATKVISDASAEVAATVVDQATDATAKSKRLAAATDKIVNSIERHANTLGAIETASGRIAASLSALESVAASSQSTMQELLSASAQLNGAQEAMKSTGSELSGIVSGLLTHVQGLNSSVVRFEDVLLTSLKEVAGAPAGITEKAKVDLASAITGVQNSLEALAATQADLAIRLSERADESLSLVGRHNDALETELSRSRDNVAKVHAALVDMTGQLAEKFESQAAR